jgi:predicted exporter
MRWFSEAYRYFAARRRRLFVATLALLLISTALCAGLHMTSNIATMLPDRDSAVRNDFNLLQQAPFARKLVITVRGAPGTDSATLTAAADRLAKALDPHLFSRVTSGLDPHLTQRLLPWLLANLPNLASAGDLANLRKALAGTGVHARLKQDYEKLLGPEGWALKNVIRSDPLDLRRIALAKMRFVNLVPKVRLEGSHLVSADGRSVLLLAETPVAVTDVAGAQALEKNFAKAEKKSLPEGVTASFLGAQRYTLANARAIKHDLKWILTVSSLALLLIFTVLLRSLRAIWVFLIPVLVLPIAGVAVLSVYGSVSAITVGFGAVLMGIAIDFGLHVYYALRSGGAPPDRIVGEVARPVVFGALTTIGAFAVLLFSNLPGQRQLAIFSIAGLIAALALALLVLPHLLSSAGGSSSAPSASRPAFSRWARWAILGGWIVFCAWSAWQATHLKVDGDLRRMSLVPQSLAHAEQQVKETWGGFRQQAMIWTAASGEQRALEDEAAVFARLKKSGAPLVSLAPLAPPEAVQRANRQRWRAFWTGTEGRGILARLRREASTFGFSSEAFGPFFESLGKAPAPITLSSLANVGLGDLVKTLEVRRGKRIRLLTLTSDTPRVARLFSKGAPPGARLVSQGRFRNEISSAVGGDFKNFLFGAILINGLLLLLLYRRPLKIAVAALPVATGLLGMFGIMGATGTPFNLFNVIAATLVIGIGVDYGIFMVCRVFEGHERGVGQAVLASGLTTLAGFGALVFARHPALHSIGLSVLLGIGVAILAALLVIPALIGRRTS